MGGQERKPDTADKKDNKDPAGEAWYAGINIPPAGGSRDICTLLMSYLGVGPKSKGVEYILSALERPGDNHMKARCLGEVMTYLANDPSDYYRRLRPRDIDYTSEHGFDHHSDDFYEALSIDREGQMEVDGIVFEISKGIIKAIAGSGRLTASESSRVFREVLDAHLGTDKKIVAAAIYNFFTAPPQKPKTFGYPVELPSSSF
jgi:hypothetical protein